MSDMFKNVVSAKKVNFSNHVSLCVYAKPSVGKTYAIRTIREPTLMVNLEMRHDPVIGADGVDVLNINTIGDFKDFLAWVDSGAKADKYKWVAIDSITELSRKWFKMDMKEGQTRADARAAQAGQKARDVADFNFYKGHYDKMIDLLYKFKMSGINLYCTAQARRYAKLDKDGSEKFVEYIPGVEGRGMSNRVVYVFGMVLPAFKRPKAENGIQVIENGNPVYEGVLGMSTCEDDDGGACEATCNIPGFEAYEPFDIGKLMEKRARLLNAMKGEK